MRRIVEIYHITKFDGALRDIHEGTENEIKWLEDLDI